MARYFSSVAFVRFVQVSELCVKDRVRLLPDEKRADW